MLPPFRPQIVLTGLCQDSPCDSGEFSYQRDNGLVAMRSVFKSAEPPANSMYFAVQMQDARTRAVDKKTPDISVSALADTKQVLRPAR
jgi:hypothetical protein